VVSPAHYAAAAEPNFEVLQAMTMMNLKIFQTKDDGALPLLHWRSAVHHTTEPIRHGAFSQAQRLAQPSYTALRHLNAFLRC
jgi:hypothetical protein